MSGGEPVGTGTYEERECRSCRATGFVMLDCEYDPVTGELVEESVPCPLCKGEGSRSVYIYERSRRV